MSRGGVLPFFCLVLPYNGVYLTISLVRFYIFPGVCLTFSLARFDIFPGFDFTLSGKGQIGALAKKKINLTFSLARGRGD